MSKWFERSRKREHELALGADADLVRDKSQALQGCFRTKIGFAFFLSRLGAKIQIANTLRLIVEGLAVVSIIAGFLLAVWAR